ncbi:MAG: hypothetical protein ACYTGS_17210, partial [Planctomycetota bacterium]
MKKTAECIISLPICLLAVVIASFSLFCTAAFAGEIKITDKTLVVWVSPANLTQKGGSALTINDTTVDRFDGVIFAELESSVWMPGSNNHSRTQKKQSDWPKET